MTIRPTHRSSQAGRYAEPGGPWDVPTLDDLCRPDSSGGMRLVDGDLRFDGEQLEVLVTALSGGLASRGVGRGDVVAWQLPNWHESVLLYRAAWRLGAVAAPLHHQVGAEEVSAMIARLRPSVCLAAGNLPLASAPAAVVVRGEDGAFATMLEGTGGGEPSAAAGPGPGGGDVAVVMFTSGSTGTAKGVIHTHRSLASKALEMPGVHGLGADDVSLMPLPMAHVSGLLNGLLVPAVASMTTVLMPRWDAAAGLSLVESERVSFMVGPPPLFLSLMEADGFTRERVSSLRVISTGAMGVSPEFVRSAAVALGAVVKRAYGSTETPTICTTGSVDPPARAVDSDGRLHGHGELRLVDPATGRDAGPDSSGEVWFRGPECFAGYLDAEQTAGCFDGDWFRTGDLGRIDVDGFLRIVGRLKSLIIRGGENISPTEIEDLLVQHPGVSEAVVVGYPDHRLGERVAAFVVSSDTFGLDECRDWCRRRGLARFKVPERVERLEEIPVLGAHKPDRAALAERAAAAVRTDDKPDRRQG